MIVSILGQLPYGPQICFEADKGTGSSGADAGQQQAAKTDDATGQQQAANGGSGTKDEKTFSQADVDRLISERLEREKRKAEAQAEQARKDAEAKALEEQGEFKKLAEQRAAELAQAQQQLTASAADKARADKLEAALKKQLDTARAGLPAHILPLLDRMDAAEQLEYLAANRAALVGQDAGKDDKKPAGAGRGTPGVQQQQRQQAQQTNQQQQQPARKPLVRL